MDLGAVQSKIEHVANALLFPKTAQDFRSLYLAKGVHATTAIEGNTLSEDQVRDRIEGKAELPGSKAYLGKEVDNIVEACNTIALEALGGQGSELTTNGIVNFNSLVLQGLPLESEVVPGRFRKHSVGVARYRGAPWGDCRHLVDRLCHWLNAGFQPPSDDFTTGFAVLKAIMAHLYLAWIHPFGDGNGRTARLVEFQILLSGGVPSVAAHLLSNFYNQTRTEYYRQLSATSQSGGDVMPFLGYAVRGLRDALDEQIQVIRRDLRKVVWRDYVYETFRDATRGDATHRRRLLALALAGVESPGVPVSKVGLLTPEIARLYANRTAKTLSRDLKELLKMGLIIIQPGRGVGANLAILSNLAVLRRFLPAGRAHAQDDSGHGQDARSHDEAAPT
jgi:Fic family protein